MGKTTWSTIILAVTIFGGIGLFSSEILAEKTSFGHGPHMFIQRFDKDGDGVVAKEEFMEHFDELDTNGDGTIDASEAPKGPPHPPGRMSGDFIEDFDKDDDARVSREEFPGSDEHFNRLDTDGDGAIDASEAPQGPPM